MIIDSQAHYKAHNAYTDTYTADPLDHMIAEMDKFGIDMSVLTNHPRPDNDPNTLKDYLNLNEGIASAIREYPNRLIPLPSIPLFDRKAGLELLEHAISKLEAPALFVRPYKGRIDTSEALGVYEKACDNDLTVFVHPVYPEPVQLYKPFHLGGAIGFMFNTTLAASYAIYSGLLESFPKLRLVFTHLGGALPFLIHRIDNVYEISESKIPKRPMEYFRMMYFDTVCYGQEPLAYTHNLVGSDKLLFGTDYGCPFKTCFVKPALQISMINGLNIGQDEKEKILGGNAAKLLRIREKAVVR